MIISFSGTSGAGKTTIIKELEKALLLSGKKVIVKNEDDFFFINLFKKFFGNSAAANYNKKKLLDIEPNLKENNSLSILISVFYPLIVYIETLIEFLIFEVFNKQTVLLKDRFIYDYLVTIRYNLNINNRFYEFLFLHSPKPWLQFFVDITEETALKRNKNIVKGSKTMEHSFHFKVIESYRNIAKHRNLISVKNDDKLSDTISCIKTHIAVKQKLSRSKVITISGLDGVGKTTLISNLGRYLEQLNISYIVVHFYHDTVLYKILKKFGFFKQEKTNQAIYKANRKKSILTKQKGKPWIWALFSYIDAFIQYFFYKVFFGRRVIIFDRFFYDYIVTFEYLNIKGGSLFRKFIPKVKNSILLTCNPENIYKRKPENTLKFFKIVGQKYLDMAPYYGILVIDVGNLKQDEVLIEVIKVIK